MTHFATKYGWFNFTEIALERHLVTQLGRSDYGWKEEGLGHMLIQKRKKFDELCRSLF